MDRCIRKQKYPNEEKREYFYHSVLWNFDRSRFELLSSKRLFYRAKWNVQYGA